MKNLLLLPDSHRVMKKSVLGFLLFFGTLNGLKAQFAQSTQPGPVTITMTFQGGFLQNVDPLNCMNMAFGNYEINIAGSTSSDVLYVIYNGYTQMDSYINTTSDPNYYVSQIASPLGGLLFAPGISDYSGYVNYMTTINKIICGGDTLDLANQPMFAFDFYPPPCQYSDLGGRVFIDNNADCTYNLGDNGIQSVSVLTEGTYTIGNTTNYLFTGNTGLFSNMYFKSDDFISANISLPAVYDFAYTIPACATPIINVTSLPETNLEFPRGCAADIDLSVYGGSHWIRPNIPFMYYPSVANIGCSGVSGLVRLVLDPNVTYNAALSSNPADYIIGDTLFWDFTNINNIGTGSGYWNSFNGGVHLTPSLALNIGDFVTLQVITDIPANDAFPSNNSATYLLPVVNSYDPNIKVVEPQGNGSQGFIPEDTEKLTYTVHFQNTGNAPAINVNIVDTLQSNVVPSSLRIINASHNMNPSWLTNSVVKFNFPNINLPDSTSNEALSHGFVTFEIDLAANLPLTTEIENTAHIYFDFNPAIVTNTTLNTIGSEVTASLSIAPGTEVCLGQAIQLSVDQEGGCAPFTYSWTGPNGFTSNVSNPVFTAALVNDGMYTCVISQSCGEAITETVTLDVSDFSAVATDNGNGTISASAGTSYMWIECNTNTPMPNGNSQTFAPTENGIYAVVITGGFDCTFTSNCVAINNLSIENASQASNVVIYPNPTQNEVTITFDESLAFFELTDGNGKVLQSGTIQSKDKVSLQDEEAGMYFFRIVTDKNSFTQRIIKQ